MAISTIETTSIAASAVTPAKLSQPLTAGTAVASTSGTSIDFTGIPSWVKRITVMFSGTSTSGTSGILIQLGTSGGIVSSGYISVSSTAAGTTTGSTAGLIIAGSVAAASTFYGVFVVNNVTANRWSGNGSMAIDATSGIRYGAGGLDLGATLDRIRITTVNGTDTFDAGSINILYE